ncbi:hypothetical protein [Rikenella microfusus]|uniref:Outer membrane protein Omp28 n=1 Tax=Rikenella microfusus TaxID=28139 RepID=A0A379MS86_9BACT|nr:hypothetical protein [Rikenella microfusus]SUE34594.1 Uncharacterised protein [Rikenella microfusus]
MYYRIFWGLCAVLLATACGSAHKTDSIVLSQFVHSTIRFPQAATAQPKIVVYVGKDECGPCSLQLPEWSVKLSELYISGADSVRLWFVVYSTELEKMNTIVEQSHIPLLKKRITILEDTHEQFAEMNQIPSDYRFHTFFLR